MLGLTHTEATNAEASPVPHVLELARMLTAEVIIDVPLQDREQDLFGHVVFFGLNLGLIGFLAGLLLESKPLMHASTPVMGLTILLAVVVHVGALGSDDTATASA